MSPYLGSNSAQCKIDKVFFFEAFNEKSMPTGRAPLKIDRASQLDCPAKNPPCLRLDPLDCIFFCDEEIFESFLVSE